jgi:hypothetical protein
MDNERRLFRKKYEQLITTKQQIRLLATLLVYMQDDYGNVCSSTSLDSLVVFRPKVRQ